MTDKIILNINRVVFKILAENTKSAGTWHYAAGLLVPHKKQVVTIPDDRLSDAETLVELGLFVKSGKTLNKFLLPRHTVFAVYESELERERS